MKAPFADTRQAKIDKKKPDEQPKDSVARIDLATLSEEEIPALVEIIDDLQDLSLIISKLELIKDRALRRMQQEKSKGTTA